LGFGVRGLGFWVWGLGFGVQGPGFGVWVLEFGVQGLRFKVQALRFGVQGLLSRVQGVAAHDNIQPSSPVLQVKRSTAREPFRYLSDLYTLQPKHETLSPKP